MCQTGLYQLTLTASVKRSLSLATVAAMPSSTRNSLASTWGTEWIRPAVGVSSGNTVMVRPTLRLRCDGTVLAADPPLALLAHVAAIGINLEENADPQAVYFKNG